LHGGSLREGCGGTAWNCHRFHATAEFFADFGTYDVKLTVPQNYVLGSRETKWRVSATPTAPRRLLMARECELLPGSTPSANIEDPGEK